MHRGSRTRLEDVPRNLADLGAYCERVVANVPGVEAIYLFGSYARGDPHEGSDLDVAVIARFEERFLDRYLTLKDLDTDGLPIQPLGYTPEEFRAMRASGNAFAEEIVRSRKIWPR